MSKEVDRIIDGILKAEGGYQNHKEDARGNTNSKGQLVGTNFGISAPVWEKIIGRPPTVKDMKGITEEQARDVYKRDYADAVKSRYGIDESNPIYPQVVDMTVNHSPSAVTAMIQRAYGSKVDGISGKDTRARIAAGGDRNSALVDERKKYYEQLMKSDPDKEKYRNGWMSRAEHFRPTKP